MCWEHIAATEGTAIYIVYGSNNVQPSGSVNHKSIISEAPQKNDEQLATIQRIITDTNKIVLRMHQQIIPASTSAQRSLDQRGGSTTSSAVASSSLSSPEVMVFNATVYWLINFVFRCMVTPQHDEITVIMACVLIAGKVHAYCIVCED